MAEPVDPGLTPAVIYAAKSTQDRHNSIPTQLDESRRMCDENGWTVVGEFIDEGFSAYSGNRGPGLDNAKALAAEAAEKHGVTAMLVSQAHDRFARGAGDRPSAPQSLGEVWHEMRRRNVWLRTVEDDEELRDEASVAAIGRRAHIDSARKSKAVKKGMARRAQAGKASGGPRPYAYLYAGGLLAIIEAEAVIVRRIFAEFVAGQSFTAIARGLERDGVPTMRGRRWRQSTVSGILTNPKYVGLVEHNGETFPGTHEPITDRDTWIKAQALVARLADRPGKGRGRPPKGRHLFRDGMLRCQCGEAMVPRTNGGHEYYYCNGRQKLGREFCGMPASVRRVAIDGAVYRYFERVGLDVEASRQQLAEARQRKVAEVAALRHQADQEARRAEEGLARVRRDYMDGRLDAADWNGFRDDLSGELEGAQAEAARLRNAEAQAIRDGELLDAEQGVLERLTEIRKAITGEVASAEGVNAIRAALSRLFTRFVLHPRGNPRLGRQSRDEPRQPGRAELLDVGDLMIELVVNEQVLVGYDENFLPILRREPLGEAKNNSRMGFPIL